MQKTLIVFILLLAIALPRITQAQWIPASGQGGSRILAFDTLGLKIFAGTDRGIIVSTDGGISWMNDDSGLVISGVPNVEVTCFALKGNDLFVGTGVDEQGWNHIFLSTDSGKSWDTTPFRGPGSAINTLAVMGPDLYAGTDDNLYGARGGIYRSTDNGASWLLMNSGLPDSGHSCLAMAAIGSTLFTSIWDEGEPVGVYRSTDAGATWTPADIGLTDSLVTCFAVSGTIIYAGTGSAYDSKPAGGIFFSSDIGNSWHSLDSGLGSAYISSLTVREGTIIATAMDWANFKGGGFYVSLDAGAHWQADTERRMNFWSGIIGNAALLANATSYFAGTYLGIFRSTNNGKNWRTMNVGIEQCNALAAVGSTIFASELDGVARSIDGGNSWQETAEDLDYYQFSTLASSDSILLAGTWDGPEIFVSTDHGDVWNRTWSAGAYGSVSGISVTDKNIFAAVNNMLLRSNDGGKTWDTVSINSEFPMCIASNGDVIALGISGGTSGAGISTSTDGGYSWNSPPTNIGFEGNCLVFMGSDIYAGVGSGSPNGLHGIILSTDSGKSWNEVNTGLLDTNILSLAADGTNLFAGTQSDGVYLSKDSGRSWRVENVGLPDGDIEVLLVVGDTLYAGSGSYGKYGVWKRSISEMVGKSAVNSVQQILTSLHAFPNPFTGSSTIAFTSSQSGPAEITIDNLLGTEVARVYAGELGSGEHSFTWDASGFAPGMYECIVRNGAFSEETSLFVVK